jgi:glycerol-3-phosphate dehydrogenase
VALVERDDFAQGTSSRSSKMVHGGLRYLQNFDLGWSARRSWSASSSSSSRRILVYRPVPRPRAGDERRDRRIGIGLNMTT